ncbi:MAG: protein phosphatase 2C domain-containing protein [Anaerolinea sp.]|nr:protein phosphatase 2C domain-containing protein [Anaerolinea sp.]
MHIAYAAFWLPKSGSREDEYEDAFAPAVAPVQAALSEFLCAVADGATETSFSGLWAQLLVEAYADKHLRGLDAANLLPLIERWHAAIDERTRAKPLPWYAEEKLKAGAYSSLLGLQLRGDGRWGAVSVGDSCLFCLRPRRWLHGFPYVEAEQFNNHPALIPTHTDGLHRLEVVVRRGIWEDGDIFLLMTDALAHYFIAQPAVRRLFADPKLDQAGFTRLIEAARHDRLCRNDDVTLVTVRPTVGADGSGMA